MKKRAIPTLLLAACIGALCVTGCSSNNELAGHYTGKTMFSPQEMRSVPAVTRLRDVTIELNLNPDGTYTESNTLAQATIKGKWTYDEGLVTITPTSIVVGGREISAGGTEIFPLSFTVNSDKTTLTELKPREATTLKGGTDIFTRQ